MDHPNVTIAYADIARVVKQLADTQRDTFVVKNNDHPKLGRLTRGTPGRTTGRKDFRTFTTAAALPSAARHPSGLGGAGRDDLRCHAAGVGDRALRCLRRFCRKRAISGLRVPKPGCRIPSWPGVLRETAGLM